MMFSTLLNAQTDLQEAPVDAPIAPIDGYVWVWAGLFLRLRVYASQVNTPRE